MKSIHRVLLIIICLACIGSAQAETRYFKWYDRDGNVYFGQKPPPGMDASEKNKWSRSINAGGSATNSREEQEDSAKITNGGTSDGENESAGEAIALLPPKDPERCALARGNLQSLSAKGRIRITDKQGNNREMTDAERASYRARAQNVIDQEC